MRRFIDSLRINVKGGVGGMGIPKYGGIGGRGGNVCLVAKEGISLKSIITKYPLKTVSAAHGEDSSRKKIFAEFGSDKVIEVPVGIVVYDQYKRLLASLDKEGDKIVVAMGGPGGSPTSTPPYCGSKGVQQVITLDLKLIADVGLVGFPNAGKSTLLKSVSRAKPKIASYPFTTIRPNIGIIEYPDLRQLKMADLPGLIEGAHQNYGMGHKFLKHVERTRLLLLVADISGFQLSPKYDKRTCLETVLLLNKELELYNEDLLNKPAALIINKMDLPGAESIFNEIHEHLSNLEEYSKQLSDYFKPKRLIKFNDILTISAKFDSNSAEKVKDMIRRVMDIHNDLNISLECTNSEVEIVKNSLKISSPSGPQLM